MARGRAMFLNTILLTATSFLMRTVGMVFQVYMSNKIGAAGIGLFQLIMSVSMLAATFAVSGIRFATTRLVSEEIGRNNADGIKRAVRRCLTYALCFGTAAMAILYLGAGYIGRVWVGDERTALSLRVLSLSLPALAMGAVLGGYFTAVCRVIKSAAVAVAEQLIRMAVIVIAIGYIPSGNIEMSCAVIVAGGIVGEIFSFLLLFALYLHDRRRYTAGKKTTGITKRMFSIALPLAFSAYARTTLSMLQNLLVPRGLKKSGASPEKALADFGMVQGMVFPIITFPSAFFYSLAELLVPELTEAQVNGRSKAISDMVNRILRLCLIFSFCIMAVLFRFSGELGDAVYKSGEVGFFIKLLALLMPIMYLDSVTDGMLRGLGQHMYSMRYNIMDSFISVILVYVLLPKYAIYGYIFILYFTELFNFALSINRLRKVTSVRLSLWSMLKSIFSALGAVNIAILLLRNINMPLEAAPLSLTLHIVLSIIIYGVLLTIFGCIERRDIEWFKTLMRG